MERSPAGAPTPGPSGVRRSVIIPMYRESTRLPASLPCLSGSVLDRADTELLLVDDGSDDDTVAVATGEVERLGLRARVLPTPHRGKGAAVATGMLAAEGAALVFTDADLSTDVGDVAACLDAVEAGAGDLVVGTRCHPDSRIDAPGSRARKLSGWAYNSALRGLGLTAMRDTQCGLKGFTHEASRLLFADLRTAGFAFDIEVLARANRLGLRVAELPVNWSHVPKSRVRIRRDAPAMLLDAIRIRRLVATVGPWDRAPSEAPEPVIDLTDRRRPPGTGLVREAVGS